MINNWLRLVKQKGLDILESNGWSRHLKERIVFDGQELFTTSGAFNRHQEKDDAWLYLLSRHHQNIVDVGCNIGQSSLLMLIGTANNVICIDPNPKALSICAENLIYNRLSSRVHFVNAFVGEDEGKEIEFFTIGAGAAGSMFAGFAKTAARYKKSFYVRTRTLESICQEVKFIPHLIKIDVEGAEQFVLRGIGDSILKNKPAIFVEMHSGEGLTIEANTNFILDWCRQHAYQPYYVPTSSLLADVSMLSKRGRYHTLLLADGVPYPEYLKNIPENFALSSLRIK